MDQQDLFLFGFNAVVIHAGDGRVATRSFAIAASLACAQEAFQDDLGMLARSLAPIREPIIASSLAWDRLVEAFRPYLGTEEKSRHPAFDPQGIIDYGSFRGHRSAAFVAFTEFRFKSPTSVSDAENQLFFAQARQAALSMQSAIGAHQCVMMDWDMGTADMAQAARSTLASLAEARAIADMIALPIARLKPRAGSL